MKKENGYKRRKMMKRVKNNKMKKEGNTKADIIKKEDSVH